MDFSFEALFFYLILIDAIFANVAVWTGFGASLNKRYVVFGKFFPITPGWSAYYLILVLWIGYTLLRLDIIG